MEKLNDNSKLTISEIRACSGFENIEEEEAHRLANFMHEFCIMAYQAYNNHNKKP